MVSAGLFCVVFVFVVGFFCVCVCGEAFCLFFFWLVDLRVVFFLLLFVFWAFFPFIGWVWSCGVVFVRGLLWFLLLFVWWWGWVCASVCLF